MKFWDSSAIVPLITWQKKTAQLQRMIENDAVMLVWWSTPVECVSAIARLRREKAMDEANVEAAIGHLGQFAEVWNEVEPTTKLRDTALRLLRVHSLRAADACQLAAAITACNGNPRELEFVSLDERLAEAARKEGFTVLL